MACAILPPGLSLAKINMPSTIMKSPNLTPARITTTRWGCPKTAPNPKSKKLTTVWPSSTILTHIQATNLSSRKSIKPILSFPTKTSKGSMTLPD